MEIYDFENNLCDLVERNCFMELVNLERFIKLEERSKFSWAWPTLDLLEYIKNQMKDLGIEHILSIGCGSGFLEWIIQQYTGIKVVGLELDKSWWSSKYSPKKFIELNFTPTIITTEFLENLIENQSNFALLFSYFNNEIAFKDYVKNFRKNVIVIIGPGPECCTYTNPEPFNPDFGDSKNDWKMISSKEIGNSKNFITIWKRDLIN